MSTLKRCTGYKGHWECGKDYPDHMVPIEKFGRNSSKSDGLQTYCRLCVKHRNSSHNPKINHIENAISRVAFKMAGNVKAFYKLPKKRRLELRSKARQDFDAKAWLNIVFPKPSNIAPFNYPPEHEKRLRRDGRTTASAIIARQASRDDGFLYIMEHPAWPERKIGWTYNPPSRLSGFNVCCPHKAFTFPYISVYLTDAKLAESIVQEALEEYHVSGEWYRVSRELAIKTIEDYVESLNDREEQAVG